MLTCSYIGTKGEFVNVPICGWLLGCRAEGQNSYGLSRLPERQYRRGERGTTTGRDGEIRTHDLLVPNKALYQAEPHPDDALKSKIPEAVPFDAVGAEFDIGFLGGGQLARMSIQAAQRMGLSCVSLDPSSDSPASQVAPCIVGNLEDEASIRQVFARANRVTLENEFIPASVITEHERMIPRARTLASIQDKLIQRKCLEKAGVPSASAVPLDDDGKRAMEEIGFPMVLKARFGGYDGKGTRYARTRSELDGHRELWANGNWMAEAFVPFVRELAVMVYVAPEGAGAFPTMETVQTNHVCDLVFPSGVDASDVAIAAVRAVDGQGLYGVELFELEDRSLVINEIAPRPHNSGHYTLDWGGVSQFEQHVRLVMGFEPCMPAGGEVCMANLLGQPNAGDYRKGLEAALRHDAVHVHWYGKAEAKVGRKMGHLNAVGPNCRARAEKARDDFYRAWTN